MSVDPLLDRVYDRKAYNCFHFAADAWLHLTGDPSLAAVHRATFGRRDLVALFRRFRRADPRAPGPAVVLMENRFGEQHIGISLRGRLLHITIAGVEFLPIEVARATYRNLRFYQ
jgi:hypothetical protein